MSYCRLEKEIEFREKISQPQLKRVELIHGKHSWEYGCSLYRYAEIYFSVNNYQSALENLEQGIKRMENNTSENEPESLELTSARELKEEISKKKEHFEIV